MLDSPYPEGCSTDLVDGYKDLGDLLSRLEKALHASAAKEASPSVSQAPLPGVAAGQESRPGDLLRDGEQHASWLCAPICRQLQKGSREEGSRACAPTWQGSYMHVPACAGPPEGLRALPTPGSGDLLPPGIPRDITGVSSTLLLTTPGPNCASSAVPLSRVHLDMCKSSAN